MIKAMKVLSFGSLNYDHVYNVEHFTQAKETQSSLSYSRGFGGKGLNQSIAMAKAGLKVYHAGKVGYDGQDFIDYLNQYDVNTDYLIKDDEVATGHAIIEVCNGENRILLYGGANQQISEKEIDDVLSHFDEGDVLLMQNETSNNAYLMEKAYDKGMRIIFNAAPMNEKVFTYPLELIDTLIVNEVEAAGLTGESVDNIDGIIENLKDKYNDTKIVMTVGEKGSYYIRKGVLIHQDAFVVDVVDTTAAGDTFTGFYLSSIFNDGDVKKALCIASKAASITVQGHGAAKSIPDYLILKEENN